MCACFMKIPAQNSVHPIIQITRFPTVYVLLTEQMKESEDGGSRRGGEGGGGGGEGWGGGEGRECIFSNHSHP